MVGTNRKNRWIQLGRGLFLAVLLAALFPAGGEAAAKGKGKVSGARTPTAIERPCREGEESGRRRGGGLRPCGQLAQPGLK